MGLSEHTPKGLWSKKSESEYEYLLLTTLGFFLCIMEDFGDC